MSQPSSRRKSISIRVVLGFVIVGLMAMSVVGVGQVAERNAGGALRAEVHSRLLAEARNLASLSQDALLSDFPELTLFPVVSEMASARPDLAFVVVIDHTGTIQGHPDARKLGTPWELLDRLTVVETRERLSPGEGLFGTPDVILASVPAARVDDTPLGRAIVGLHRSYVDDTLNEMRSEMQFVTALLMAVGVALALAVVSLLMKPVAAVRRGLERIGSGDLDTPMPVGGVSELGLLAETVNRMATQLKHSREKARAQEQEIIDTQKEVIQTLGDIVESRSKETGQHIVRVGRCAYHLARLAGLSEEIANLILVASPMHDVGKIGIPDAVLNKPGKLTKDEFDEIKRHTTVGHELLSRSDRPLMRAAAIIAHQHHEKWNGKGYPRGLSGEDIHIFGRIVGLVDVFDALSSPRSYKPALPFEQVAEMIAEDRGEHFDPTLVDLFLAHYDEFIEIFETYRDSAAAA